jgi:succinate dehydrogenase/fumarate reductase-like Fe-S protein
MNVDGTNTVACLKPVDAATREAIRYLVVDLTIFYMHYK